MLWTKRRRVSLSFELPFIYGYLYVKENGKMHVQCCRNNGGIREEIGRLTREMIARHARVCDNRVKRKRVIYTRILLVCEKYLQCSCIIIIFLNHFVVMRSGTHSSWSEAPMPMPMPLDGATQAQAQVQFSRPEFPPSILPTLKDVMNDLMRYLNHFPTICNY